MSRKSNLTHFFIAELKKETKFGESKDVMKKAAREEAARTKKDFKQVKGIFSYKTYNDYKKSVKSFVSYVCEKHSEVKNMEQAKKYIPEYIDHLRERELSEWTIHSYSYALRSCYHCEISELGITLGTRSRADIKRCRDASDNPYRNHETYERTVLLAKATGCRRNELLRLRKEDFREQLDSRGNPTGAYEVFKRGKGGIERWCLVAPAYNTFVKDVIATSPTYTFQGEERLLRKADIPNKMPIHDCRSDYACALYNYYSERGCQTGNLYHCRKDLAGYSYDKGLLDLVSYNLQHARDNVVIDYLWKMR